jgi:hypothetical protein
VFTKGSGGPAKETGVKSLGSLDIRGDEFVPGKFAWFGAWVGSLFAHGDGSIWGWIEGADTGWFLSCRNLTKAGKSANDFL